jgi:hypothetical protein
MVRVGDGRVAVLHQAHVTDAVPLDDPGSPAYGSGACEAVARPLVTWLGQDGPEGTVRIDAVLAVDLAFSPEGDGAFTEPTPLIGGAVVGPQGAGVQSAYPPSGLQDPVPYYVPRGTIVQTESVVSGVAFGPAGAIAVTRQPFSVIGPTGTLVAPEGESDRGFALFHQPSPSGVACATCHAEGRDDGHTWDFGGLGLRRTQSLVGGLLDTGPWREPTGPLDAARSASDSRRFPGSSAATPDDLGGAGPQDVGKKYSQEDSERRREVRMELAKEMPAPSPVFMSAGRASRPKAAKAKSATSYSAPYRVMATLRRGAEEATRKGDFRRAIALLEQLLRDFSRYVIPEDYERLAEAHKKAGDFAKADSVAARMEARFPKRSLEMQDKAGKRMPAASPAPAPAATKRAE